MSAIFPARKKLNKFVEIGQDYARPPLKCTGVSKEKRCVEIIGNN
jgi:hypothetical protein